MITVQVGSRGGVGGSRGGGGGTQVGFGWVGVGQASHFGPRVRWDLQPK